ncbi:MAG: adenylyl-sulfate kinase [Phycisphaerae bacterium]|nr:adenylyl-sulfate kinase [Phycisphaerae bacterium]
MTRAALATQQLETWLAAHGRKDLLRFLTCGNVDDGKSTLIGRLLLETESVPKDVLAAVERDSKAQGTQGEKTDLAFLTDGLKAEREQGITIDVAYRTFATDRRRFLLADTPGHEQYTRNMATGASTAELAIILIDARHGVTPQTRRHSFITSLLGIRQAIVAVNKMDLAGWDRSRFDEVRKAFLDVAAHLPARDYHVVPISALLGDNVVKQSPEAPWYTGPTILELLETLPVDASGAARGPFRFPVQLALRPSHDFRGFAGTIASGRIRRGETVVVLPSGRTAQVERIVDLNPNGVPDRDEAFAPMAVTITLDREVDCSRGDTLVRNDESSSTGPESRPETRPTLSDRFEATLVWMDETPLLPGKEFRLKHGTCETTAFVTRIISRIDVTTFQSAPAEAFKLNDIGRVELRTARPLVFDPYRSVRATGSFILMDRISNATSAAGLIEQSDIGRWLDPARGQLAEQRSSVTSAEREARYGQKPVTVLLTGLSGAGKSAVARALERSLFDLGRNAIVIDGEAMRAGLSRDLGFSAADRSENLRRAMEFAKVLNGSGLIAIAAFVAPQAETRARCKALIGHDRFVLVHLAAPLDHCRTVDPSRIYRQASEGIVRDIPGIDVPYDVPTDADLTLPSHELNADTCADRIMGLLRNKELVI